MDKSYQSLYDNSIYSVKLSLTQTINYKKYTDNERDGENSCQRHIKFQISETNLR